MTILALIMSYIALSVPIWKRACIAWDGYDDTVGAVFIPGFWIGFSAFLIFLILPHLSISYTP